MYIVKRCKATQIILKAQEGKKKSPGKPKTKKNLRSLVNIDTKA